MAAVNKLLQTMGSLAPGGTPTSSQPRNWNFLYKPQKGEGWKAVIMFADVFEMKMVFRAMSYMLGTIIIFLAVFFMFTDFHIYQTLNWVREMLGYSFLKISLWRDRLTVFLDPNQI